MSEIEETPEERSRRLLDPKRTGIREFMENLHEIKLTDQQVKILEHTMFTTSEVALAAIELADKIDTAHRDLVTGKPQRMYGKAGDPEGEALLAAYRTAKATAAGKGNEKGGSS